MATRFYLRATTANVGTLVRTEKSTTLPVGTNDDAGNAAKDLDRTIGAAETSYTNASLAQTTQQSQYLAKWISEALPAADLSAQTWTVAVRAAEGNAAANAFLRVSIYVLTSADAVRGFVYDATADLGTELASGVGTGQVLSVTGAAVTGVVATDRLVVEVWIVATQTMATAYTNTVYFDGANAVVDAGSTQAGAYIETPQDLFATAYTQTLTDAAGLVDTIAVDRVVEFTDSAGMVDDAATSLTSSTSYTQTVTDAAVAADSLVVEHTRGLSADLVLGGDTVAFTRDVVVTDSAGLIDDATTSLTGGGVAHAQTPTDSAGITDTVAFTRAVEFTDTAGLVDTSSTPVARAVIVTDPAGLTDTSSVVVARAVVQTDAAGITDTTALDRSVTVTDSAGLTDSASTGGATAHTVSVTDAAVSADTTALDRSVTVTDSAGLIDTASTAVGRAVIVTDSVGLVDTLLHARAVTVDDLAGFTDSLAFTLDLVLTDSAGLVDTATAGLAPLSSDGQMYPRQVTGATMAPQTVTVPRMDPRATTGPEMRPRVLATSTMKGG